MIHPTTNKRSAFTLLEIIIAASLATAILLILWSLFGVYSKLEQKGSQATTEIQLVRGLLRQLQSDLGRLTTAPAEVAKPSPATGTQPPPITIASPVESVAPLLLPDGVQLVGDRNRIKLVLAAQPTDNDLPLTNHSSRTPPAVFKIVQYQWQPRAEFPGLPQLDTTNSPRPTDNELSLDLPPTGLRRHMVSWSSSQPSDSEDGAAIVEPNARSQQLLNRQTDDQPSRPEQEDLIPEVTAWQLEYFDGITWVGQWDSVSLGRMPVAVKVSFDLEPPVEMEAEEVLNQPTDQTSQLPEVSSLENRDLLPGQDRLNPLENPFEYQFVIAINTTRPLPEEESEEP